MSKSNTIRATDISEAERLMRSLIESKITLPAREAIATVQRQTSGLTDLDLSYLIDSLALRAECRREGTWVTAMSAYRGWAVK